MFRGVYQAIGICSTDQYHTGLIFVYSSVIAE